MARTHHHYCHCCHCDRDQVTYISGWAVVFLIAVVITFWKWIVITLAIAVVTFIVYRVPRSP